MVIHGGEYPAPLVNKIICYPSKGNLLGKKPAPVWTNNSYYLKLEMWISCFLYPYKNKTGDIRSTIALCLREFPRAKPEGTPEGEGLYLTTYPEMSQMSQRISMLLIPSLISLAISLYTVKYMPGLKVILKELKLNIKLLRMIYWALKKTWPLVPLIVVLNVFF